MNLLSIILILNLDTLPPEPQLYESLAQFHQTETQSQLSEFDYQTQHKWLRYLPSVGLTYTPEGDPRPGISWSSNLLFTSINESKRKEARIQSITQVGDLQYQKARYELEQLLLEYHQFLESINFQRSILEIDRELFVIQSSKYAEAQLKPSEFLQLKRAFLLKEHRLVEMEQELARLEKQILGLVKWKQ
jgi:hypothetical protein